MCSTRILVRKDVCDGRALNKTASIIWRVLKILALLPVDRHSVFLSPAAALRRSTNISHRLAVRVFTVARTPPVGPTPRNTKRYSCLNRQLHLLLSTIVENCLPRSIWCHLLSIALEELDKDGTANVRHPANGHQPRKQPFATAHELQRFYTRRLLSWQRGSETSSGPHTGRAGVPAQTKKEEEDPY